ncbi:MAG TPA: hypothetical protein VMB81_16695 [Candidatus Sulfotelmatobacter sp.]|nr:hypothetical protein [Candidatus Sulfotelmatobacter sp.]
MTQKSAYGAGDHPETLENALIVALRTGVPVGTVADLAALLESEIGDLPRVLVEVEKGLSRSGASAVANFRGSFFDFLRREYLPELERAILASAPLPSLTADESAAAAEAATLNVVEAAELLVLLTRLLAHRGIATDIKTGIADAIVRAVGDFGDALSSALERADPPDMHRLAREVEKLELLRWVLEILETAEHHRTLSTQMQVAARRALHRATASIERFLELRHADTRLDTAHVTGEIEDLVTLVLVLVEAERESREAEAHNPFFRALSHQEIAGFMRQAEALAALMFDEMEAFAAGTSDADSLERPLRQVMQLSSFAGRLGAHVSIEEIEGLRHTIARRLAALEARMGGRPRIMRRDD